MNLFEVIDDAIAIARFPKGIYKQTKVYRRGDQRYIPHAGGYLRITAKFGETWGTSNPDIKIMEMENVDGI